MQSALEFPSSQLSDSCLERKSKTRRLEIWVFKIVSFVAFSFNSTYLYASRTPRLEVGTEIHLRVWRRPQKSDAVKNPPYSSQYCQLTFGTQLGIKLRCHLGVSAHADEQG